MQRIHAHERTGSRARSSARSVVKLDTRAPCEGTFDPDARPSTRRMLSS